MNKLLVMGSAAAALLVAGGLVRSIPDGGEVPAVVADAKPRPPAAAGKVAARDRAVAPPADPARREAAASVIQDAVVTYSPAGVAAIRPYLLDPDPAIRQAARDGLVQLGEADAIPYLREAAGKAADPAEQVSLREAADLLALPTWSETEEARAAVEEILRREEP